MHDYISDVRRIFFTQKKINHLVDTKLAMLSWRNVNTIFVYCFVFAGFLCRYVQALLQKYQVQVVWTAVTVQIKNASMLKSSQCTNTRLHWKAARAKVINKNHPLTYHRIRRYTLLSSDVTTQLMCMDIFTLRPILLSWKTISKYFAYTTHIFVVRFNTVDHSGRMA